MRTPLPDRNSFCARILLLLLAISGFAPFLCAQTQVVVIANSRVTMTSVSKAELREVFTGASSSLKGGGDVTPVLLKQGPANDGFLDLYIGKSDAAFRATWRSLLFSGQNVMPKMLDSDAAMVEYVARTAGAVGYVGKMTPHEGVKILVVR
jgi:ABC-type phosphate transport system substrate-binding protein